MRHYTTIEQSKRLLELGLKYHTADCCWVITRKDCRQDPFELAKDENNLWLYPKDKIRGNLSDYVLPCWSVGALEDIIWKCEFAAVPVLYNTNTETGYWMDINLENGRLETKLYSTIIDACFEMVCLLLENKYIKV